MAVVKIIISLYAVVLVGVLLKRFFKTDNKILTYFNIYFAQPCLLFYGVYAGHYQTNIFAAPLWYALVTVVVLFLAYVFASIMRYSFEDRAIVSGLAWAGNNGNFGIPVILMLLGEQALAVTALLILINTVFLSGPAVFFFSLQEGALKQSLLNILKTPLLYAVAIGLLFNFGKVSIPSIILDPIKMVGNALVPVQLVLLGTFLGGVTLKHLDWKVVGPSVAFKLIIMPVLAFGLLKLFSWPIGLNEKALLLECATPFAVMTVSLADLYKRKPEQVAMANFVSLFVVIFTLPILWWFIGS